MLFYITYVDRHGQAHTVAQQIMPCSYETAEISIHHHYLSRGIGDVTNIKLIAEEVL